MSIRKTFSIRFTLALVTVVAIALTIYPSVYRRVKWNSEREQLLKWASTVKRKPHHCEVYGFQAQNGQWCSVSTASQLVDVNYSTQYDGANPDPTRFFVTPPGKWVDTADEILDTWDQFD